MTQYHQQKQQQQQYSWAAILAKAKEDRQQHVGSDELLNSYRHQSLFASWKEQMANYEQHVCCHIGGNDDNSKPKNYKELVLETRAALRFGLFLICSLPNNNNNNNNNNNDDDDSSSSSLRRSIQNCMIHDFQWHDHLASILTYEKGDSKCRLLAAQLLSNTVTGNPATAEVVSSKLPLSPSKETVNATILRNSLANDNDNDNDNDDDDDDDNNNNNNNTTTTTSTMATTTTEPTWVDMILTCAKSGNREAMGAVVAALHNCIAALLLLNNDNDNMTPESVSLLLFATKVASNSMMVSTLLRQFVRASNLEKTFSKNNDKTNNNNNNNCDDDDEDSSVWDSATEWIYLLVIKLSSLGMLVPMYNSISNTSTTTTTTVVVLPEQNVLLHCIAREAESYGQQLTKNHQQQQQQGESSETAIMPLGGELGTNGSKASCTSVADLLGQLLRNGKSSNKVQSDGEEEEEEEEQDVAILRGSAVTCLVDIFAILMGVDSPLTSELRSHLGSHTTLLQDTAKQLGLVVDDLTERSFGKKAREVTMLPEEQQFLTGLVRLLGNMCFSCRINQDLMRTTLVPPSLTLKQIPTVVAGDDGAATAANTDPSSRNALHVLLSCTSFTTSCFTLREWSVIAIRNVLEHNTENQELVAALDAQNPVQSAALDGAGVRVNMDSKGKVSLTPLKEGNEEGEGDG